MKQCIACGLEHEEHLSTCSECGENLDVIPDETPQKQNKSTLPKAQINSNKNQSVFLSSIFLFIGLACIYGGLNPIITKMAVTKGIDLTDIFVTVISIFIGVLFCKNGISYSKRWNYTLGGFLILFSLPFLGIALAYFNKPETDNAMYIYALYGSAGFISGIISLFKNKL